MTRQLEPVSRYGELVDWFRSPRRLRLLVAGSISVVALVMAAVAVHLVWGLEGGRWMSGGRVINVADYRTEGRSDVAAIQAAIDAASPGDTVFFPSGTYRLDKPFYFGSGINHVGQPGAPVVLLGRGPTSLLIHHDHTRPLLNTTIRGFLFDNVELRLSGNRSYTSFVNVTITDCIFQNGKRDVPWQSDYIWLSYTVGITIDGCTFLRNAYSGGRGVVLERTRSSVIKDSYFGTTRNLEPGAPNGYFKTAINVTGYDEESKDRNEDILIDGNVLRRNSAATCPTSSCEDHGMYAWGVKNLFIVNNQVDGWSNTVSGGAVKVRNSEDVFIVSNNFKTSGVLAYTHWHGQPRHFERVLIADNRIDLDDRGTGIAYRRANEPRGTVNVCKLPGGEADVHIVGNVFPSGGSIDLKCGEGRGFCVADNRGSRLTGDMTGVRRSGCRPSSDWNRPLLGVHRGDFNGDGKEDFVHRAWNRDVDAYHWRAHLTFGDGFRIEDWDGTIAVADDTDKFGVHIGDYNGDGRDDLAYRGTCDGRPCWRVHHSTDGGFTEPLDYGDSEGYNVDTLRFGLVVGDFNGDGRDDILFPGTCGGDRSCWLVLASQPDHRFAVADWGNGGHWHPTQTDEYGLLVGDFNGDGRDDIAYRGQCGDGKPCWRVHLSEGERFAPYNWGDEFVPDPREARHFGLRVGDADGDGRADIAYRGRCGNQGKGQWRYHRSEVEGRFAISCSEIYVF